MNKHHILAVTYVTDVHNPNYLNLLVGSSKYFDIPLVTLGRSAWEQTTIDLKKRIYPRLFKKKYKMKLRWTDRVRSIEKFLQKVDPEQVVLFTDGYDTFFQRSGQEILKCFHEHNQKVVFGTENNCHPDSNNKNHFVNIPTSRRYPNGGGFIGRSENILRGIAHFNSVQANDFPYSDQYRWQRVTIERPDLITLDLNGSIFRCLAPDSSLWKGQRKWNDESFVSERFREVLDEHSISDGRLTIRDTGVTPCVLHFNGGISRVIDDPLFAAIKPWLTKSDCGRRGRRTVTAAF